MWRWLLALAPGCSFSKQLAPTDAFEPTDASEPTDEMASVDRCWSIAELQLTVCPATMPVGTFRPPSSVQIDTASDPCAVLKPTSSDVCVVAANAIIVDAGIVVSATGARPLVLLAVASIEIHGSIDVASHFGGQSGPASDLAGCDAGTAPANSGGGQGGSLGGVGGNGGNAFGGIAGAVVVIDKLRGGCPGAIGDGSNRPDGRRGGGAVALVAETITLGPSSTINASGAAGDGADTSTNGGSGGGSGGMIVFQGTTIAGDPSAGVFANGGGGGGGSGSFFPGGDRGDESTGPASIAMGGSGGGGMSADGGDGGSGAPSSARDGASDDAGGGGGGGAGVIKIYGSTPSPAPSFSPPPS